MKPPTPADGAGRERPGRGGETGASARGHEILPHTADAGIRAWAPGPEALMEELATGLADLSADLGPDAVPQMRETVTLVAEDAEALCFAWLGELIGLVDVHGAIVAARVWRVERPARDEAGGEWRLTGEVGLVAFDGVAVRRRADVKSPTYHGLVVTRDPDGAWHVSCYVDI